MQEKKQMVPAASPSHVFPPALSRRAGRQVLQRAGFAMLDYIERHMSDANAPLAPLPARSTCCSMAGSPAPLLPPPHVVETPFHGDLSGGRGAEEARYMLMAIQRVAAATQAILHDRAASSALQVRCCGLRTLPPPLPCAFALADCCGWCCCQCPLLLPMPSAAADAHCC